jgi:hypothetical protein
MSKKAKDNEVDLTPPEDLTLLLQGFPRRGDDFPPMRALLVTF